MANQMKMTAYAVFMLLMTLVLASAIAHAAGSKLIFSDVDVKVGSRTSKNLIDGETIHEDAKPGDTVELKIEVKNNFTNEENLDIQDVSVDATIEELDDGEDVDEESKDFDINQGSDKRITLKFQVPIEVDEDTFNVRIDAEGEDDNGTQHSASMRLKLEVNKENHLIEFTRKILTPAEVSCSRKSVQLALTATNIGNDDEQDVRIEISNQDLGLDVEESILELLAEPGQEESRFSKAYKFNVPAETEEGSYTIMLRALYNDEREKTEDSIVLTVSECLTGKKEPAMVEVADETGEDSASQEVEVISPAPRDENKAETILDGSVPPETTVSQEGIFQSETFIIGVIVAEIVAVVMGIVLLIVLFRKREQ